MDALAYALVAVGGAMGSMARAWMGIAVGRLTGPQFPWGTILINILGSFGIAFFGTLTTMGGRFPASTDARTFVMVGLCGGFTTFSSFSLQTLDLARDGRPAQALANIALSIVLCMVSVTAGYWGAALLNNHGPSRRQMAVYAPLSAATSPAIPVESATDIPQAGVSCGTRAEDWGVENGDVAAQLARATGATLVRWPVETDKSVETSFLASADELLLVLPERAGPLSAVPGVIAVASVGSSGSQEQRAVRSCLPLLQHAARIVVLCGDGKKDSRWRAPLADHGMPSRVLVAVKPDRPPESAILEAAHRAGARFLLIAASKSSDAPAPALDDVTQRLLSKAHVPVLVQL